MTETNLTGAALEVAQKRETQGLNLTLGVHCTEAPLLRFWNRSLRPAASWRATWRLSSPSAWR